MQNGWNIEEWRLEDGWIPVLEEPSSVFLSFHFAKWMSSCLWSYDLSLSTFLFTLFSSSERCSGKDRLQLHWDMINLPRIQSFINFFIESAGYVSAHDLVSEMLRKRSTISETQLTTSPSIPRNFFLFFKDDTGNRWINASTPSAKTKRRDETSLQRISFIWKQGLCDTE